MKKQYLTICAVIGAGLLVTQQLSAITLSFANVVGANVEFLGINDTFHFNPGSSLLNQFRITASDGVGDSVTDMGRINGTFHIGAITINGGLQTAPVTGVGSVVIHDGSGFDMSASLVWNEIQTSGTAGSLNLTGLLNLSSVTYHGAQSDLHAMAAPHVGTAVLSFTFIPARTLTQLTANASDKKTSFSGTLNAQTIPDGGATLMMLGAGIVGMAFAGRSRKSN